MEIGQVVDLPFRVQPILGYFSLSALRHRSISAEDDHIQTPWWGIVNPFCSEGADGMERGQVDLFCVYELVLGRGP